MRRPLSSSRSSSLYAGRARVRRLRSDRHSPNPGASDRESVMAHDKLLIVASRVRSRARDPMGSVGHDVAAAAAGRQDKRRTRMNMKTLALLAIAVALAVPAY